MARLLTGTGTRLPNPFPLISPLSEAHTTLNMAVTLLAGLLRSGRPLAPRAGAMIQQRASYIHGKQPKHKVGVVVSARSLAERLKMRLLQLVLVVSANMAVCPAGVCVRDDRDDHNRPWAFWLGACTLGGL